MATGSDTNIQESGVGEYDDIKRVGDLVFSIDTMGGVVPTLRVHRIDGTRGTAVLLHSYPLPAGVEALGLHVRVRAGHTQLVLLAGRSPFNSGYDAWCFGYAPLDAGVLAIVHDVAADGALAERHRIELQGSFSTSRLIGASLMFASSFVVATDGAEPVLPKWRLDDGPWQDMATLATLWLPNFAPDAYERALTTLSQFDLDAIGDPEFASVFARIDASYVAPSAWYLATSEYRYDSGFVPGGQARLDIHKIALPALDYRGTGSVAGGLGVGGDDRALRFSEHAGDLRVITDHSWSWSSTSLFELNVLREDGGSLIANPHRLRLIALDRLRNARVAVAFGAHARVGQDLRDRVLGRRAGFAFVGARQVRDVVGRVVVADVLQRGGDAFDQVGLADDGAHDGLLQTNQTKVMTPNSGIRTANDQAM